MKTIYINGSWLGSDKIQTSFNPSNKRILGEYSQATETQVNDAIKAATNAFSSWSRLATKDRSVPLANLYDLLIKEFDDIGKMTSLKQLIMDEVGKPFNEADIEVMESADIVKYYVDNAEEILHPQDIRINAELWPTKKSQVQYKPLGVVVAIKPWNYPLELPLWSIAAALSAGNTVIFKPSENSSLIGVRLAELFEEAGFPQGTFNMLTGDGIVGQQLVKSKDIAMVSFTGSQETGKQVSSICAENNTRVSTELGGKDSMILLDDVDIEFAAQGALWGAFTNCGQVCVGVEKIFVPNKLLDRFVGILKEKSLALRAKQDIGPLVSEKQLMRFKSLLDDALAKGAKLLLDDFWSEDVLREGYYMQPNFILNANDEMRIENEEIFGPLASIHAYDDINTVIDKVNSAKFDLGASIWSSDNYNASQIANLLNVGMVWVNDVNIVFPEAPWCGARYSGTGVDLSDRSLHEYTRLQHISIDSNSSTKRDWWYPYS